MVDSISSDDAYQALTTLGEYRLAVDKVILSAQACLSVFDTDLVDVALEEVARYETLRTFLVRDRTSRLQIVVREATYIQLRAVRIQQLLRDFPSQIEIRLILEVRETDAFIYSDTGVCLYRPQHDHPKSILTRQDSARYRLLQSRMAFMLTASEQAISAITLGL